VQDRRVHAAADDRLIRGPGAAATPERVVERRRQLVLVDAFAREPCRGLVALARDLGRAAHHVELFGLLEEPHLVDDRARIDHRVRRRHAGARPHARELHRLGELGVELRVAAQHVIDARRAGEQPGELVDERADRMRLVGTVVRLGALEARPIAGPRLGVRVARLDEEGEGGSAVLAQQRGRVRMVEAGQVVEVAVLAEREGRVVGALGEPGAEEERDRAGLHRIENASAAGGVHGRGSIPAHGSVAHTTRTPAQ
jgi:hypothetical protein